MTESSSLFQDKPSHVEKPGVRPGSLSPPLGRHGEPGAKPLLRATASLEHRGARPNAELLWLRGPGGASASQLILLPQAGL